MRRDEVLIHRAGGDRDGRDGRQGHDAVDLTVGEAMSWKNSLSNATTSRFMEA